MTRPSAVLNLASDIRPRELRRAAGAALPHPARPLGVEQEVGNRVGHGNVIGGVHKHAGLPVGYRVKRPGDLAGHDRQPVRAGFQIDDAEALSPHVARRKAARHDEHVRRSQELVASPVAHRSQEGDVLAYSEEARLGLERSE